jgi:hypothetical protein
MEIWLVSARDAGARLLKLHSKCRPNKLFDGRTTGCGVGQRFEIERSIDATKRTKGATTRSGAFVRIVTDQIVSCLHSKRSFERPSDSDVTGLKLTRIDAQLAVTGGHIVAKTQAPRGGGTMFFLRN